MKYVDLPSSKSISNRLLLLQQTVGGFTIEHLSQAEDTIIMDTCIRKVLESNGKEQLYVDNCGTACRFLTAWLSTIKGEWTLQGNARMQQRPIAPLVNVLRSLGADITYMEEENCLPLLIKGKKLKWKSLQIDASLSSQFVTAIMLIIPQSPIDVEVEIPHGIASQQYVLQTVNLMKHLGVNLHYQHNKLFYRHGKISPLGFIKVEPDWSSAAFWYEYMALNNNVEDLFLNQLQQSILQKDSVIAEWMQELGVQTIYTEQGAILHKQKTNLPQYIEYHCEDNLDLVPVMALTCAFLKINAIFKGVSNLQYKESNRIHAITQVLHNIANVEYKYGDLIISVTNSYSYSQKTFDVYHDHRIAMALAMSPCIFSPLEINDIDCVKKSYPLFWSQWHNICMYKRKSGNKMLMPYVFNKKL